jgi:hypothetical protein
MARRFNLGDASPLRLSNATPSGQVAARIKDLSSTGVGFGLPTSTHSLAAGQTCVVRLGIEDLMLELNAKLSRVRDTNTGSTIGADLTNNDHPTRRNLVQLLEPIEIGASLQPIDSTSRPQTEPDLVAPRCCSSASTALTVWRQLIDQKITGFEWRLHDFYVRSGAIAPELTIYVSGPAGVSSGANVGLPPLRSSSEDSTEVRRLFDWILPNLNSELPIDIREFLSNYGSKKT